MRGRGDLAAACGKGRTSNGRASPMEVACRMSSLQGPIRLQEDDCEGECISGFDGVMEWGVG